jgi:hypothetical protein
MTKKIKAGSLVAQRLTLFAEILSFIALGLGLNFLLDTTGGTLFLFASVAPLLVMLAIAIVVGVGIYKYNTSHHLFDIETYAPGETIFRQGEYGDCAYFIHSGAVEIVRQDEGQEKVLAKLAKDEYFGEMALLTNAPRNATVRAAGETRVAVLGKSNFLTLLSVLPTTKEDILKTVHARAMQQAAGR